MGMFIELLKLKKNDPEDLQVIIQNSISDVDKVQYAFGIRIKNGTVQIAEPADISEGETLESILAETIVPGLLNITPYKDFTLSSVNIDIPTIPLDQLPSLNPDLDQRPFLTKISDGSTTTSSGMSYSYWELTATGVSHVGEPPLWMLLKMKIGSKVVLYSECLKNSDGTPYLYTPDYGGIAEKVFGYAYQDTAPNVPKYPIHYTPISRSTGVYWFQGNGLLKFQKVTIPAMIIDDIVMSGVVGFSGDKNSPPDINGAEIKEYFRAVPMAERMTKNNFIIRKSPQPTMPKPVPDVLP